MEQNEEEFSQGNTSAAFKHFFPFNNKDGNFPADRPLFVSANWKAVFTTGWAAQIWKCFGIKSQFSTVQHRILQREQNAWGKYRKSKEMLAGRCLYTFVRLR